MRKAYSIMFIFIFALSLIAASAISATYDESETVSPEDYEAGWLLWISDGDDVDFEIDSNEPINVYIMDSTAYYSIPSQSTYSASDFSDNEYSRTGVTSTSFTWTVPDTQTYYLVMFNPSQTTDADVDYSYTDTLSSSIEDGLWGASLCGGAICAVVAVVWIIFFAIAIWVYKDAEKRGKSGALWLIICLLTGIIGIIIWLIVRPKEIAGQQPGQPMPGPQQPYAPGAAPPPATAQQPQQPQQQTCPGCGAPIRYIDQYQRWYCDRCQKYL
jgi:hypothetical protein